MIPHKKKSHHVHRLFKCQHGDSRFYSQLYSKKVKNCIYYPLVWAQQNHGEFKNIVTEIVRSLLSYREKIDNSFYEPLPFPLLGGCLTYILVNTTAGTLYRDK